MHEARNAMSSIKDTLVQVSSASDPAASQREVPERLGLQLSRRFKKKIDPARRQPSSAPGADYESRRWAG
jgi:hypothetical protein